MIATAAAEMLTDALPRTGTSVARGGKARNRSDTIRVRTLNREKLENENRLTDTFVVQD